MVSIKNSAENWFKELQHTITTELEILDGKGKFMEDLWTRPEGGGGRTRSIADGNMIEKGGVNFQLFMAKRLRKY